MEPSGPRSDCLVLWTVTGSDGSDSFSLKRRRPDSFLFFFSLNGVILKQLQHFFFPSYTASFCLSQNHSSKTLISHFSITLNPHSSLPLSNPHTLKSQSLPRAVAPSQLSLSPSRRRTSQLSLFVTLSSHFAAQPLSRVAIAAQPRSQLPRRRRSSAQVWLCCIGWLWSLIYDCITGFLDSWICCGWA